MGLLDIKTSSKLVLQMLETFSGLAIGQMVAERATLVMRMSETEDWDIVAASHKTGGFLRLSPQACISLMSHEAQASLCRSTLPERKEHQFSRRSCEI